MTSIQMNNSRMPKDITVDNLDMYRLIDSPLFNSIIRDYTIAFGSGRQTDPAHSIVHCYSVANMAISIADEEKDDDLKTVIYLLALFHEFSDSKMPRKYQVNCQSFLFSNKSELNIFFSEKKLDIPNVEKTIMNFSEQVSWSKNKSNPADFEYLADSYTREVLTKCLYYVRDADRIMATGNIGYQRAIEYGNYHNREWSESFDHFVMKTCQFMDEKGFHYELSKTIFKQQLKEVVKKIDDINVKVRSLELELIRRLL